MANDVIFPTALLTKGRLERRCPGSFFLLRLKIECVILLCFIDRKFEDGLPLYGQRTFLKLFCKFIKCNLPWLDDSANMGVVVLILDIDIAVSEYDMTAGEGICLVRVFVSEEETFGARLEMVLE